MQYKELLMRNIREFSSTRIISSTVFRTETQESIDSLRYYRDPYAEIPEDSVPFVPEAMPINWVKGGTVATAYNLQQEGNRVAMLDFADAKKPGGWPEEGAPTQEENICRCSNLYEILISKEASEYYRVNNPNNNVGHEEEPYTDALLYVPKVVIFKDDSSYKNIASKRVDVIVSPAPCGYTEGSFLIMDYRIAGFLKAAYENGATDLVLGAWGCGVFGQPVAVVARAFGNALRDYNVFNSVTFAFRPTYENSTPRYTAERFKKAFESVYYG